MVAH
jgi:DNA-binding transcriptional ArsR family regulator